MLYIYIYIDFVGAFLSDYKSASCKSLDKKSQDYETREFGSHDFGFYLREKFCISIIVI